MANNTNNKIMLDFFTSNLNNTESDQVEKTGMVILASDFLRTAKVSRAEILERISKISVPILLSKTTTGKYIAINPSGANMMKVPIMQLPSLEEITTFVSDPSNLDLDKIYKQLLRFKKEEAEIRGGYNEKATATIEELLKLPRGERSDFKKLSPVGDMAELKNQLKVINQMVYDDASLTKAINDRMTIIENALSEEAKEYKLKYDERAKFWKAEIDNASTNLKKRLKERDTQLEADKKALEKETSNKISQAIKTFFKGVSKNIRKDEVPIEKAITELEAIAAKAASSDNIASVDSILQKLRDLTTTFAADIDFQLRKIKLVSGKEAEFLEIQDLDIQGLEMRAERDKAELIEESKNIEKRRDEELALLKADREASKQRFAQFKDKKDNWANDIHQAIGGRGTAMIPESSLKIDSPAKMVELHIPMYIYQYRKNENLYTVAVPPVKLPSSMKKPEKGTFFGEHKTVSFLLLSTDIDRVVTSWLEKAADEIDMMSTIQTLPNILDDPTRIRNDFFESQNLFLTKLKVDKKKLSKANERLTEVFSANI